MRLRPRPRAASEQHSRLFMLTLGGAGIAAALLLTWVGFNAPNAIPGRSYYTLRASFDFADNLTAHYQVRMGGRNVGQVLHPRVEHGKAVVDLQLEPGVAPLRSDTRLRVRPRSPIGVRYVELFPGRGGRPLHDGDLIPASQTSAAVQLDEVLDTFTPKTRKRTQTLLNELGVSVAGRGEGLNAALVAGEPFLHDAGRLAETVTARPGAVPRFLRGAAGAVTAFDPVRAALADGFDAEARALAPFADRRVALRHTLEQAPPALDSVRSGLHTAAPLLDEVTGFARTALPGLRAAPAALRDTAGLLTEVRPGLRDAQRTLRLARQAVAPTLQALAVVRPVLPVLELPLVDSLPIVDELLPRRCDLLAFFNGWGEMLAFGNTAGNFLRFNVIASTESIGGTTAASRLPGTTTNAYPAPCVAGSEGRR